MGGQTDLMISVRHIREFLLPGMKRMIDLAHQAGAFVFHHNDGSCWRIIPDMIGRGHRPPQSHPVALPGHGAGEAQAGVRPTGSSSTAAWTTSTPCLSGRSTRSGARSRRTCESWGEGGGYILAPCHNIQALTPVENVVAMYETGREIG